MNDVTNFLAITAGIFAAMTVLLAVMSHLESNLGGQGAEEGPSDSGADGAGARVEAQRRRPAGE